MILKSNLQSFWHMVLASILLDNVVSISSLSSREVTNTSKAGLAWPNGNSIDISQFTVTGKVSWYYTWNPTGSLNELEFVPMLWGTPQISQFTSTINSSITNSNVTAVLGMNEPQETGQSNLTPQQGADMWITYLEPLRQQGVRLGSPAPSSNPNGKTWLQNWLSACAGNCTVDFIALHYYDINATKFQEYLEDFHNTFQKPLWVTEWACQNFNDPNAQCSMSDIVEFLNQTQTFMDNIDYVERYSWYGAFENLQGVNPDDGLLTPSGLLNDLGKQYIGLKSPNPGTQSSSKRISTPSLFTVLIPVNAILVTVLVL